MEEKEELQGCRHDVSTVKKSEKVPYFDMFIQTESSSSITPLISRERLKYLPSNSSAYLNPS